MQQPSIVSFQNLIWSFYAQHKRAFAWRHVDNPYCVVVSEIMLQQTQTYRVESKYEQFMIEFPTFEALATASLRNVLSIWQGLGYNRRGKALHEIAQKVVNEYGGQLPQDPQILETFPGIGKATAASICAFAFNAPVVFIETNIRTVFIHSFFKDQQKIHDKELIPLIQASLDTNRPREWYYALMDYGVYLKKMCPNPSRRSLHYTKQSRFEGSDRQVRGMIIKMLTQNCRMSVTDIIALTDKKADCVKKIVEQLCAEQLIVCHDSFCEIK